MKRKRDVYDNIWDSIINPEIAVLTLNKHVSCKDKAFAKERVWDSYCEFNWHSANHYLEKPDGLLDRHKVAACYMYAIVDALPLEVNLDNPSSDYAAYFSNERLAITMGISILGMFDRSIVEALSKRWGEQGLNDAAADALGSTPFEKRDPPWLTPKESTSLLRLISHGLSFPDNFPTPDGSYYDSVLVALCSTKVEKNFNIPTLALLLYHWEIALVTSKYHKLLLSIRATTGENKNDDI